MITTSAPPYKVLKRLLTVSILTLTIIFLVPYSAKFSFTAQAAITGDINGDGRVDVLDFQIFSNSFGKTQGQSGYNANADLNRDGRVDVLDFQILNNNFGGSDSTPTRTPTTGPTNPPGSSQWGIYPNCNPPAMPVEAQSWWLEGGGHRIGDASARHIHAAACMPHARDESGNMVTVRGTFEFTRMIMIHNSNISLFRGDNGFPELGGGGVEFPLSFNPQLTCPNRGDCTFYSRNTINTTIAPDGLHELRWRIQGRHPDIGNDEDFISFGTKIYIKNGRTVSSTANNASPRARGWYEAVDYDTSEISNYVDLYRGRTDITVPIVSGVVPLQMNHTQSVGPSLRSRLYLDPNFHAGSHGTLLYDKPGLFRGTYNLDTTRIPNGRHVLVVETANSQSQGTHSGILKVFIDVRN